MPVLLDLQHETATDDLEPMLTRQDLARIFRVSLNTVTNCVARGEFPQPVKIGRQWRWSSEQIREWLDEQRSTDDAD